jgi:hypothetical protein
MAYEIANYVLKITLVAAADLSALKYNFVKLDSAGKAAAITGLTDKPIGILQNAPVAGEEAEVLVMGGSKLVVGSGGLTEGAAVKTSAAGLGIALTVGTDTTHYLVGQSLTEAAASAYATVVINCANAARGA